MNTSVIIITKNEEKNIEECIKTLEGYDEIIVVDDNSSDATAKIAKKLGAQVYEHSLEGDFAAQRNFGLQKAKGSWILFIDADERMSPQLKYEIHSQINDAMSIYSGFYIRRIDKMWGKTITHGESSQTKFLRLAKKGSGDWIGMVHERWMVNGKVGMLKHPLMHFPHQTIREFVTEINYYTDLRAGELNDRKVKVRRRDIFLFPLGKFIQNYFFRLGILDGLIGLLQAILMSFHSFLVRGKLWLLQNKNYEQL